MSYCSHHKNHLLTLLLFPCFDMLLNYVSKQNAAMFPVDDPTSPPLIGPSTIVVVNDARHQLQPEFLQRTTPYFFDVDAITQQYKWAKVCRVEYASRGAVTWSASSCRTHDDLFCLRERLLAFLVMPSQVWPLFFFLIFVMVSTGGVRTNPAAVQERSTRRPPG